ncbi:3913_t:CDS:2, partial [Funneliformis geosporum]
DQAERESKKNRKFQTRCIQIAKEILNEEPMIEYRSSFLNGLELDAFFQKYQIALEMREPEVPSSENTILNSISWNYTLKKVKVSGYFSGSMSYDI